MRRFVCVLLTAVFACGLSACNDKAKSSVSKEEQAKVNKGRDAANEYQLKLKAAARKVKDL